MKRERRETYRLLTTIELLRGGTASMCDFCKYAEWGGGCQESYPICRHPLFDLSSDLSCRAETIWAGFGEDCWAFQPAVTPEEAADMVGIWLQGMAVAV